MTLRELPAGGDVLDVGTLQANPFADLGSGDFYCGAGAVVSGVGQNFSGAAVASAELSDTVRVLGIRGMTLCNSRLRKYRLARRPLGLP